MAITKLGNVGVGGGPNGGTTAAVDTTGGNFIAVVVNDEAAITVSDSKTNTWTALTNANTGFLNSQIFYSPTPTVGTSHTFTVSGTNSFSNIEVIWFSGVHGTPFDVENTNVTPAGTTVTTGNVTPGQDNSLLIAGLGFAAAGTITIDTGFTITDQFDVLGGQHDGGAMAYLIQGAAAATNPTWTNSGASNKMTANIAVFKPAAVAAAILPGHGHLLSGFRNRAIQHV